jgi:hypothetical protein
VIVMVSCPTNQSRLVVDLMARIFPDIFDSVTYHLCCMCVCVFMFVCVCLCLCVSILKLGLRQLIALSTIL